MNSVTIKTRDTTANC